MIPMINLKKQFDEIRDEVLGAMVEVLDSTRYILGPKVAEFEEKVAAYTGVPAACGVASGTDALSIAVKALGIRPGDEVITTPFTFFSTVEAILYEKARPVFVDIDLDTFNIDAAKLEEKVTPRTKAIIPVHMFGHPADMGPIMEIADRRGIPVIEDCAQAFGASLGGTKVGAFGAFGCFSFYPSKNLGAFGDAGLMTLRDETMLDAVRMLRNHGSPGGYRHLGVGYNSRLDELQAAVLLVKFGRIDEYNRRRREKAARYSALLAGRIACPVERPGAYHVYHQYTVRSPRRDDIRRALEGADISSMIYYPVPMHLQEALRFLGYAKGDLPIAEEAAATVLSLPICPELADADLDRVADVVLGA